MDWIIEWGVYVVITVLAVLCGMVVLRSVLWGICRLLARRCPECKGRWNTELQGEWGGEEDWKCHSCGAYFYYPPRKPLWDPNEDDLDAKEYPDGTEDEGEYEGDIGEQEKG